jgi:hypothetical protein
LSIASLIKSLITIFALFLFFLQASMRHYQSFRACGECWMCGVQNSFQLVSNHLSTFDLDSLLRNLTAFLLPFSTNGNDIVISHTLHNSELKFAQSKQKQKLHILPQLPPKLWRFCSCKESSKRAGEEFDALLVATLWGQVVSQGDVVCGTSTEIGFFGG